LLCALLGCGGQAVGGGSVDGLRRAAEQRATIDYAVDGDTLRVRLSTGDLAYVRLVGIDTPEDVRPGTPVECGAIAAAASMRQLATEGAAAILKGDSVADTVDRYGRTLAHAFIGRRQLELAQLRRGWAEVYRFGGQRFDGLSRFESSQDSARRARRGVWGPPCGGNFHSSR
jgi:micrococcal nuclease